MPEGLSARDVGEEIGKHATHVQHEPSGRERALSIAEAVMANPNAPRGPTDMPQYRQHDLALARSLDAAADDKFDEGAEAGETSDKYIRSTVFLATVLFLVGISTHFPFLGVRYGLIVLAAVLLVVSVVQLAQLPRPPV
jgi:hypothetical protein